MIEDAILQDGVRGDDHLGTYKSVDSLAGVVDCYVTVIMKVEDGIGSVGSVAQTEADVQGMEALAE